MTNNLQKYPNYKPSGVEWLGDIPEHWEVSRIGLLLNSVTEKNRIDLPLLSITREKGVILRDLDNEDENHNFIPDDLSNYKVLRKGEFGMNKMKAWQGSYGISDFDGIVSPAYYTFILGKNIEPTFFHVSIRSKLYISFFGSASDGVRIGQWDLSRERMKQIPFLIPPLTEQIRIAEFLDRKTAQIDQAIAIKVKQIELLKERRQILIHRAVTKGIKPDVKMKDSGVEWIGEIPEHWEVKKLRYTFRFGKGLTITKENLIEEGVLCVNYGEIHSKYSFELKPEIHKLKCVAHEYLESNSSSLLNKGDFIFADTSEDIEGSGNFTFLNSLIPVFAGYHTIIARPIRNNNSKFLAYEFDSIGFRTQIQNRVKGVKVFSITQTILKELKLWFPSFEEQEEIVKYLDSISQKITTATSLKEQEIEKMKEYKSVLINGAVTGKIKV